MNSTVGYPLLSHTLDTTSSFVALITVVLRIMQSPNFKTVVMVYDKDTSHLADMVLTEAQFINIHHDWVIIKSDNLRQFYRNQLFEDNFMNPEYCLNIFLNDINTERRLSWTIMQVNAADVRMFNIIVSDQPLDPRLFVKSTASLYQRRYLLNLAVLQANNTVSKFYTVNPFDMEKIIVIDANETDAFNKVFFDKSKNMNSQYIIRCESAGSKQMMRLQSKIQHEMADWKNQQFSKLIEKYFNAKVVSNRMFNGTEDQIMNEICLDTGRWEKYQ